MNPKNTKSTRNQPARFAKIVILLTPFIVAAAGATMYQESKSHSPKVILSSHALQSEADADVVESWMVGEPFSNADGVNSVSFEARPKKAALSVLPAQAQAPTGAQAHSATERQFMLERFDHSVVILQATAHDSDLPGAAIGAY